MALENLKENIEMERKIVRQIISLYSEFYNKKEREEKETVLRNINSLIERLKMTNNAIPEILNSISVFKKLKEGEEKVENLVKISYTPKKEEKIEVTIGRGDKEKFVRELSINREGLERLKAKKTEGKKEEFAEFRKPSLYIKSANKFFFNLSNSFLGKGYFKDLNWDLRKANMPYLISTYLSMAFFSTFLAFALGIVIFVFLIFFKLSLSYPFIQAASIDTIIILRNSLIILALPVLTFISFYFYPATERKSIEGKIDQEMPFVVIHMSAIAGSGIEPTQIFKIVTMSEEYPATKKEIKKIINQVNVYGYDFLTALKNTARETSSKKLAELFNGIASTISGGSSLKEFLEKRAETLLFDYKLEKEKSTKSSETFMDIYISIMLAAPMIMTLLLVLIGVSGISIGLSMSSLAVVIVLVVAFINFIFMAFLHLTQQTY